METSIQKICCPRATNHFGHRNVLPAKSEKSLPSLGGSVETHSQAKPYQDFEHVSKVKLKSVNSILATASTAAVWV